MKVEGSVRIQGEKDYRFESVTSVTGPDGKMTTHKTSGTGQWLGNDCGLVEPASARR